MIELGKGWPADVRAPTRLFTWYLMTPSFSLVLVMTTVGTDKGLSKLLDKRAYCSCRTAVRTTLSNHSIRTQFQVGEAICQYKSKSGYHSGGPYPVEFIESVSLRLCAGTALTTISPGLNTRFA
jgi:hypothetical protein